jgi:hypothetical protein
MFAGRSLKQRRRLLDPTIHPKQRRRLLDPTIHPKQRRDLLGCLVVPPKLERQCLELALRPTARSPAVVAVSECRTGEKEDYPSRTRRRTYRHHGTYVIKAMGPKDVINNQAVNKLAISTY